MYGVIGALDGGPLMSPVDCKSPVAISAMFLSILKSIMSHVDLRNVPCHVINIISHVDRLHVACRFREMAVSPCRI